MFDIGILDGCPFRGKPTEGATYLLTERGNPGCQYVLVREYFTPKLHRRLLVGRFVDQMWAWDDHHSCWIRLKARSPLCPAMKSRPPYPQVDVRREIEGKAIHENMLCHRIMAAVWCPNDDPEHKTQVDHLNGDINDYSQFNLEWVTPEENIRRAVAMRRARKQTAPFVKNPQPRLPINNNY